MIFINDSAKLCPEAGKGLICFSWSLYLLQGASPLRPLDRRGNLREGGLKCGSGLVTEMQLPHSISCSSDYCKQKHIPILLGGGRGGWG